MDYLYLDGSSNNPVFGTTFGMHIHASREQLPTELEHWLKNWITQGASFSAVAFGTGPGSHTGTRATAALAKGIALGLKLPIKHFPSLLLSLPQREGKIGTSLLTRKPNLHYAFFYDTQSVSIECSGLLSTEALEEARVGLDDFGHTHSPHHLQRFLEKSPAASHSAPLTYLEF